jgi:AraC-like DNA-binding protein
MLIPHEATLCEIAATLGFCDQSHFTRTFRRMAGMSPGQYARSAGSDIACKQRPDVWPPHSERS